MKQLFLVSTSSRFADIPSSLESLLQSIPIGKSAWQHLQTIRIAPMIVLLIGQYWYAHMKESIKERPLWVRSSFAVPSMSRSSYLDCLWDGR